MKIVVFSDIHGNLEALTAAYDAVAVLPPANICHLGDLGGYAPFVNEVVAFLIRHGIEGVQGNYDEAVADDREHCGCRVEDPSQEEMAHLSFTWTKDHVSPDSKSYMKNLPKEMEFIAEGKKVRMFHATPKKNNLYWYEDRPEKFFREMAENDDADIMIFGHTHIPYRKDMEGKVFINAGSVGRPKDGSTHACAAIVDITPLTVTTEFIRVPYEVEKVAAAICASGLPRYYADRLRHGR